MPFEKNSSNFAFWNFESVQKGDTENVNKDIIKQVVEKTSSLYFPAKWITDVA